MEIACCGSMVINAPQCRASENCLQVYEESAWLSLITLIGLIMIAAVFRMNQCQRRSRNALTEWREVHPNLYFCQARSMAINRCHLSSLPTLTPVQPIGRWICIRLCLWRRESHLHACSLFMLNISLGWPETHPGRAYVALSYWRECVDAK